MERITVGLVGLFLVLVSELIIQKLYLESCKRDKNKDDKLFQTLLILI